jgi:hypothetical protein
LGVTKEGGEFGQLRIITLAQESLKEFGAGPVAHKENRAREQRSDRRADTER